MQAAATDLVEAKVQESQNGKASNKELEVVSPESLSHGTIVYNARAVEAAGRSLQAAIVTNNGNGNGNGNGVYTATANTTVTTVPSMNGNGAAPASTLPAPPLVIPSKPLASSKSVGEVAPLSTASLDNAMDPNVAGQIETVAATSPAREVKKPVTAAGTPYSNPGGRWSQFKTYSVFQVGGCGQACALTLELK